VAGLNSEEMLDFNMMYKWNKSIFSSEEWFEVYQFIAEDHSNYIGIKFLRSAYNSIDDLYF